jgi:TolB-like protein/class 3 adenylate cyclase
MSTREQRRLAAIAAADVVGYSRLMGRDESGTLARLREHRTQRLEPTLARHGGRLVKLTGDGALVEFGSAVDALGAAIEFQQAMAEANQDQPEDTCIVFRIGLHLGDLIVDGDDLYGDGVNVAARLEAEAPAGGIVISRTVHEAVAGRLKAVFDDLGSLALKNIERPVQAFGVRWDAGDWKVPAPSAVTPVSAAPQPAGTPLALPDKPSIAVLPFQNMSGDPEQEYFADGIVEDIITALSRFKSLFVIARNSSFTYKGKPIDIRQVGRELGVRYVLEGSVRKAGGRVRITGQLIDSGTGGHIWADRYDGDFAEIFELQDRVTTDVVGAITPKLEQAEIERTARKPTDSPNAYDCYLRAMSSFYSGKPGHIKEARDLCYQAMRLAPDFAGAYGMAAFCDALLIGRGELYQQDAVAETQRVCRQAIELDRDDPVILSRVAWAQANVVRDLEAAAGHVELALTLNPNLAMAWAISGWVQLWSGAPELAIEHLSRAMRLSPLDPNVRFGSAALAHAYFMAGRNGEAWSSAEKAVRQWATAPAYRIAAASAALAGQAVPAAKFVGLLLEVDPDRRVSNLTDVLGPYRRSVDVERYKQGLRLAGLPE